jgi:hypothetical protein
MPIYDSVLTTTVSKSGPCVIRSDEGRCYRTWCKSTAPGRENCALPTGQLRMGTGGPLLYMSVQGPFCACSKVISGSVARV